MSGIEQSAPGTWRFEAIGTAWSIETDAELPTLARDRVRALIDDFDRQWSRFRGDSLVSDLAPSGGTVRAPQDAAAMLALYDALDAATAGAVSPLVGASLGALGYDASYSLCAGDPVAAPEQWRNILGVEGETLSLTQAAVIDVGAIGKGRLVDLVHDLLRTLVGGRLVVDAGGDVRATRASERIGLEHPFDHSRIIGVVELRGGAMCGSAITRRAWGDGLHHVLDARTGEPVRTIAATWALAPTAMHADAIATALFFEGGAALAHRWGIEWVRMTTAGRVEWSPGFGTEHCRAELFT